LIQAVFNKALFVKGGPKLHLLYILVAIMAAVPLVNGAIGILQTYETTKVGQLVMRDLRERLYAHLETLSLAFFWLTKLVGDRRRRVSRSTQEALAAMSAISEETLSVSGVLLAKVFGNQGRDIGRYRREEQRLADPEGPQPKV